MSLSRKDLEAKLEGFEGKDDVINYIMSENGKSINELRAENETLKSQILDKDEQIKGFGDYDEIKKANEELNNTINGYKEKEANKKYYETLTKVGMDKDFIDESIFNKIPKNENMEEFEKAAKEFLKEKPKYAAEEFEKKDNTFDYNGFKQVDDKEIESMTDEQLQKFLSEQNK